MERRRFAATNVETCSRRRLGAAAPGCPEAIGEQAATPTWWTARREADFGIAYAARKRSHLCCGDHHGDWWREVPGVE